MLPHHAAMPGKKTVGDDLSSTSPGPPAAPGSHQPKNGWDKPKLNFIIDALMFLVMMAMAGLGFLMKYVLVPGRERWVKYGRNVNLTLGGWDRHDWGVIHLYLGFLFLGLLTLHIILHWKLIVALFERLVPPGRARSLMLVVFVLVALLLIYFPFLLTPEVTELSRGGGRLH